MASTDTINGDLLEGAGEIAGFLFGKPEERRRIYHLAEKSKLPVFRLGITLCARKSALLLWIQEQEEKSLKASC